jgi:hypothetical protein
MEHLKGASFRQAPACLATIRLDWKGLQGTNTLAYCKHSVKFIYNIGHWCQCYKTIILHCYCFKKPRVFVPTSWLQVGMMFASKVRSTPLDCDTQHNDTPHNDTPHNDTPHNDTQHNDAQHNDTQHNDIQCLCSV